MNQKQRDSVVIGLLSVIAVLALVAATRTLPAPPVPQYDTLETTIRNVLQDCELYQTTKRTGYIGDIEPVVYLWDCSN
jgi:hypothetical protein